MISKENSAESFKEFIKARKRKIVFIFVVLSLLIVLFYLKDEINTPYIYDEQGKIIGISREGEKDIPIYLQIEKDGKIKEQETILHFRDRKQPEEKQMDNRGLILETEFRKIVRSIEEKQGKKIYLPQKAKDGIKIIWKRKRNYRPLLLFIIFPISLYAFFYSENEKVKKNDIEYKKKIKQALPGFNHQLLLLINSGLIFSDAFNKIALSYKQTEYEKEPFKKLIVDIHDKSEEGTSTIIKVMNDYCIVLGQREFSRFVSIITEHEYKGSDLREKLQSESEILWESRKKDAEVQGKIGETKLSFPLAILLTVLIMITAAPAVLSM